MRGDYLIKECFDTVIVNDGEEALKQCQQYAPNLILLDLMLPGMDGYEVCREVRKTSNVKIIPALSAAYQPVFRAMSQNNCSDLQ